MATADSEIFEEPKVDFDSAEDIVRVYVREVCTAPKLPRNTEIELAKAIERGADER